MSDGATIEQVQDAEQLTLRERTRLRELEATVEQSVRSFLEGGRALRAIRDERLYRETHATFEAYAAEVHGIARSQAYRQIDAAGVVDTLSPIGDTPTPATEAVARELVPLQAEPEKLREAWSAAVEAHGPKPTARQVREVVSGEPPAPPMALRETPAVRGSAANDQRFELLEDAVGLLDMLPDPDEIVFPDEPGDMEAVGEAIAWFTEWTPKLARAWRAHKAALKQQRSAA